MGLIPPGSERHQTHAVDADHHRPPDEIVLALPVHAEIGHRPQAVGHSEVKHEPVEIVVTTDHGENDAHEDGDGLVHFEPFRLVGW